MEQLEEQFNQLELEDKICGICADIKENEYKLKCGHSYCYDCIYDWFKMKVNKKKFKELNSKLLVCPYCKKSISKLKLLYNHNFIKGITQNPIENNLQQSTTQNTNQHVLNNNHLLICNAPLKSKKNMLCNNKSKHCYGYYCGIHKNYAITNPKINNS
jgi:hypothetical protein